MKNLLLRISFLLFLFPGVLYGQSTECYKSLRKGTFAYVNEGLGAVITRTKTLQTEIYNGGKSKLVMKVKWLSDTEYILTLKKRENAPGEFVEGDVLDVKIINCENGRYDYKCIHIRGTTVIKQFFGAIKKVE